LMAQNLKNMKFQDFSDFFPCFVTIISIPFTYSIIDGIALGFILYPICKICTKKQNEISIPMYIIAAIFLLYFIIIGLIH
ncbi:NCS2 family permease, partial [Clostridium butyricum]